MISPQAKRTLFLGVTFVFGLVALAVVGGFGSQAVYCFAVGDFSILAGALVGFGLAFLVAGAQIAFTSGAAMSVVLSGMAISMGPIGWAIFAVVITAA